MVEAEETQWDALGTPDDPIQAHLWNRRPPKRRKYKLVAKPSTLANAFSSTTTSLPCSLSLVNHDCFSPRSYQPPQRRLRWSRTQPGQPRRRDKPICAPPPSLIQVLSVSHMPLLFLFGTVVLALEYISTTVQPLAEPQPTPTSERRHQQHMDARPLPGHRQWTRRLAERTALKRACGRAQDELRGSG